MPERLLRILMPPKLGASDHELYLWRWVMVLAVFLLYVAIGLHASWTAGSWPFEADQGFVEKQAFTKLANDNRTARINTLMTTIGNLQEKICKASGDYRVNLTKERTRLLREWNDLSEESFPLASCEDMGI